MRDIKLARAAQAMRFDAPPREFWSMLDQRIEKRERRTLDAISFLRRLELRTTRLLSALQRR